MRFFNEAFSPSASSVSPKPEGNLLPPHMAPGRWQWSIEPKTHDTCGGSVISPSRGRRIDGNAFTDSSARTTETGAVAYLSERGGGEIWFGKQLGTRTTQITWCRFLMQRRIGIRRQGIGVVVWTWRTQLHIAKSNDVIEVANGARQLASVNMDDLNNGIVWIDFCPERISIELILEYRDKVQHIPT